MKSQNSSGCGNRKTDHGPNPFVANIPFVARQNPNYRTAFWTGSQLQMTLMTIPVCGDIGLERHSDTDQIIRVEEGYALIKMGNCREDLSFQCRLGTGDAAFVPCGTWHNVCNIGNYPLKLSSVYAPPQHSKGTVHCTKADAEKEDY